MWDADNARVAMARTLGEHSEHPLAAGSLYPRTGWLLSPMIAGTAVSLSSVSVIANALRLGRWRVRKQRFRASGKRLRMLFAGGLLRRQLCRAARHVAAATRTDVGETTGAEECCSDAFALGADHATGPPISEMPVA